MKQYKESFELAAEDWICDSYFVRITYLALKVNNEMHLWDAFILINPLPPAPDLEFHIDHELFCAGQYQLKTKTKKSILKVLTNAIKGTIRVHERDLELSYEEPLSFYSEGMNRDRWFSDLHLNIMGVRTARPTALDFANIDIALRNNNPPFDGIDDLVMWLGLTDPRMSNDPPSIKIRINPPVDLLIDRTSIKSEILHVELHAISKFKLDRVHLAVRASPGIGLASRQHLANQIIWGRSKQGIKTGILNVMR